MMDAVGSLVSTLGLLWIVGNTTLLLIFRRELGRVWREPVFRHPVLVLESDDWGAGPLLQAQVLRDLAEVLARHRDAAGHTAVLNLALVLAVPDGNAIRAQERYGRVDLGDSLFAPILDALRDGCGRGVFALQLHGMEHYWPATLMASEDAAVHAWLRQPPPAVTEQLPSHLQSRWVDARHLPSRPHADAAIAAAVIQEVSAFERILGTRPAVVVPPTFVWTREVERVWAREGLECVVTPGWRYTARNDAGQADGDEGPIVNGDRSGDILYVARCDYFEPLRGRDAQHALRALDDTVAQGRACLLENHRDNFLVEDPALRASHLAELDALLRGARGRHPQIRFLSTRELARLLSARDAHWLELGLRARLPFVWNRLRASSRLWKLMRLSGLAVLGELALRIFRPSRPAPS